MSIVKDIQNKIGKMFVAREQENGRAAKVYNYKDAGSLAVIFKFENEDQYKAVRQYLKFVKEEHGVRRVMALAYIDDKELPHFIQSRVDFEFFTKKEVNWQQKPSGTTVTNFIEEPYNILIDLTDGGVAVLQFVLGQSKAEFKVGRSGSADHMYDMIIDMSGKNLELKPYLEQVNHYLTLINRPA